MPERPSRDPRPREDRAAQEALVDELVGRIRSRGSIPFAEYMEAALYHPVGGYYTSGRSAGGVDFRTSPQMHRAFGELLAAQVLEMRRRIEDASRFRIVELGPGDGTLAQAFLDAWGREAGDGWEYHLVETSPALRKAQRQRLASLPAEILRHTAWSDADALAGAPCDGVVLSNEFFDALPVHAVRRSEGRLLEVRVGWEPDAGFVEVLAPAEGDELAS